MRGLVIRWLARAWSSKRIAAFAARALVMAGILRGDRREKR